MPDENITPLTGDMTIAPQTPISERTGLITPLTGRLTVESSRVFVTKPVLRLLTMGKLTMRRITL